MRYKIKDRKIQTSLCEVNVVHHCNLSCRACSHLSHRAKKYYVNPDQVLKDFSILAKFYHPQHIRLLGGEPLLHPNLLDVIDAVRESGISEIIRVVTNGILLGRMPDVFWKKIDQIHITVYPECGMTSNKIHNFLQMAKEYNTEIEVRYVKRFRETFSESGTDDPDLRKRIYSTCQIAHTWRCQAVFEGYFFRCSPSIMIPLFLQNQAGGSPQQDGLKLKRSSTFIDDLYVYLTSKIPLNACGHCLGTVGKRFVPTPRSRQAYKMPHSAEDIIDWKYLRYYEFIGNRQMPDILHSIGVPIKKMLLAVRHINRKITWE